MESAPSVIIFDVNETLSDMSPMARRFTDVGAPAHLAELWFASLLRDGFALTAVGTSRPFADLGAHALRSLRCGLGSPRPHRLRTVLHDVALDQDVDAGIRDQFGALPSVEDAGIWKPARAA